MMVAYLVVLFRPCEYFRQNNCFSIRLHSIKRVYKHGTRKIRIVYIPLLSHLNFCKGKIYWHNEVGEGGLLSQIARLNWNEVSSFIESRAQNTIVN